MGTKQGFPLGLRVKRCQGLLLAFLLIPAWSSSVDYLIFDLLLRPWKLELWSQRISLQYLRMKTPLTRAQADKYATMFLSTGKPVFRTTCFLGQKTCFYTQACLRACEMKKQRKMIMLCLWHIVFNYYFWEVNSICFSICLNLSGVFWLKFDWALEWDQSSGALSFCILGVVIIIPSRNYWSFSVSAYLAS